MPAWHTQDLDYDAAIPIYINRRYLVEYLHTHVFSVSHKNILEDFLYQTLMSNQYIAMSRANDAFDPRYFLMPPRTDTFSRAPMPGTSRKPCGILY